MCGGIAAYKAIEVCRQLVDAGARVSPVMTRAATRFVGEVTFTALAGERVRTSLWEGPDPIPHTRLGQAADALVIVPATARLIGTYAAGISSDLLTATLLATRAPVVVCPAMHTEMWEHPAVTDNLAVLVRRGVHVVAPRTGRLAGGDVGAGRLADPADIVDAVAAVLAAAAPTAGRPAAAHEAPASAEAPAVPEAAGVPEAAAVPEAAGVPDAPAALGSVDPSGSPDTLDAPDTLDDPDTLGPPDSSPAGPARQPVPAGRRSPAWEGVEVLVTAGGTREPIDAVRYVGNRSSGKQGHALAAELAARGAAVTLVTTVDLPAPEGARLVPVDTAEEMALAVGYAADFADVVVMAAAVADFRPKAVTPGKWKKADGVPDVILEPTPDILASLGAERRPGQVLVGFAAETVALDGDGPDEARDRLVALARGKLAAKGVDLVVANDVASPDVGFTHDTNAVVIVGADGTVVDVDLRSKADVACAVVDAVEHLRSAAATGSDPAPLTPTRLPEETP